MQYLSEGTRAESRLRLLSNRLNSHAVTKLACQDQSVCVIPSLGGRILDFRAYGRGWLAEADPDNFDYPAPDGYLEYAGYLTGSLEAYTCRMIRGAVLLEALLGNGLRLHRRISLGTDGLSVRSELRNISKGRITTSWGARWVLALPDGDARLEFDTESGGVSIPEAELGEGFGSRVFEGASLPRQLAVTVAAGRFVVRHRMQGDMIRFTAGKRSERHSLSLYYCTNLLDLPPGKAVSFSQTMTFSRMVAGK